MVIVPADNKAYYNSSTVSLLEDIHQFNTFFQNSFNATETQDSHTFSPTLTVKKDTIYILIFYQSFAGTTSKNPTMTLSIGSGTLKNVTVCNKKLIYGEYYSTTDETIKLKVVMPHKGSCQITNATGFFIELK